MDNKTIYDIDIIGYKGLYRLNKFINIYKFIIIFILIGLVSIIFLSKLIFSVEVITNDKKMENKILKELEQMGIKKYNFKKSYDDIQKIKGDILNKYKHEIDWIEIEVKGTKYIVRYEPRIESDTNTNGKFRNIIAKKNALIYKIDVSDGQVVKEKDNYVHKGDLIVSGYIYLNDKIVDTVSSKGHIYGEVWYKLNVKYPLDYHVEKKTGNKNTVYVFKFINKRIELFNLHKFKYKKISSKDIINNSVLPIKLVKEVQEEKKIIDRKYNEKEAIEKSIELGKKKIEKKLSKGEYVIDSKVLNSNVSEGIVTSEIFYTVCEDITDYQEIEEYKENTDND